jgi:biopolymer transport protein TolQ
MYKMTESNLLLESDKILKGPLAQMTKSSILDLFLQAELLVQIVMLLLLLASIWCWTIIFSKIFTLQATKLRMNKFLNIFHTGKSINQLYKYSFEKQDKHPLAKILFAAIEEWQFQPKSDNQVIKPSHNNIAERVNQAMILASSQAIAVLEESVGFLATIASSAPFIGLFGTVWGIMNSFQSIAATKNTTLAVVAPGIAEALLATAFGLIAAIPAFIFYNKFMSEIDNIARKSEDFKLELHNLMLRELN